MRNDDPWNLYGAQFKEKLDCLLNEMMYNGLHLTRLKKADWRKKVWMFNTMIFVCIYYNHEGRYERDKRKWNRENL